MNERPKAILLHTATNDLENSDVHDIVNKITDCYELVAGNGIKFVWSAITPRGDNTALNAKAELVNAMVASKLAEKDDAIINRNDNFYTNQGTINKSLYADDMVHVKGEGVSKLANNSRFILCRALGKDVVAPTKKPGYRKRSKQKLNKYTQ